MRLNICVLISFLITLFSQGVRADEPRFLDITKYEETFSEDFRNPLDVTPRKGPSKWIAHTPYNEDWGKAEFANPTSDFPFTTGADGLTITARKNFKGKWESGLLCSQDSSGRGFSQTKGYFEARMKMPDGVGVWPAFWLIARGHNKYTAEIDVIEYYGDAADRYELTAHLWPKNKAEKKPEPFHKVVHVEKNALTKDFHTYGAEIEDFNLVFYLDRKEVARMPLPKDTSAFHFPFYLTINLALGAGRPLDKTPDPSVMYVDYVKVYKRKTP